MSLFGRSMAMMATISLVVITGTYVFSVMERKPAEPSVEVPPVVSDGSTVEVTRSDIAVVVSLNAMSVANPVFELTAPQDGVVSHAFEMDQNGPTQRHPSGGERFQEEDGNTQEEEPVDDPTYTDPTQSTATPVSADTLLIRMDDGSEIKTPVSGVLTEWLVPDGTFVQTGVPLARMTFTGFALKGTLPAIDAYRLLSGSLSARGAIADGPAGFDCILLQPPLESAPGDERAAPEILCAIDTDMLMYPGLPGRIALDSGQVEDVLTLPVTAVSGNTETGEVTLVHNDESSEVRAVTLGATDGAIVEIVSGLDEGDRVSATPPLLVR